MSDSMAPLSVFVSEDRECPEVLPPTRNILSDDLLFDPEGRPHPQVLADHFVAEGRLAETQLMSILERGTALLRAEPNMLILPSPIVIVGDIHGQFYDLLKMFEVAGSMPPEVRFLFLGDYVDRGYFSIEAFLYLMALKISYPDSVHMLRGNHECRHLTAHFTFRLECVYKYSEALYDACMAAFDALPLAAVVNGQLFCVHGGIGPDLASLDDVGQIHRFSDPPKSGLFCDLLWADPDKNYGSEGLLSQAFQPNHERRCSYRYTYKAVNNFLHDNNLLAIIRAHEAQDNGYRLYEKGKSGTAAFPSVITIFSAPNYCDLYNNKGAIIKYDTDLNIRQFKSVPHPYYLPKFMNAFEWSMPFLGEKVAELLMAVLQIPSLDAALEGLSGPERERLEAENEERDAVLREKLLVLGKVGQMYNDCRAGREALTELDNVVGIQSLPSDELAVGDDILRSSITTFKEARESDLVNEKLPERGTLSLSPLPEVAPQYPSPELAALTDDDIVSEISSSSERPNNDL